MTPSNIPSPISLSYIAALRGVAPRQPGAGFTYAVVNCTKPWLLMCLAASNPEGRFYGLVTDSTACAQAVAEAQQCHVENVVFLCAAAEDALNGKISLPSLNYLYADETVRSISSNERSALFDLAKKFLLPGGLFHYSYRAYENAHGALRFLVREFAPEMTADQSKVFLRELKTLGASYFADNAAALLCLDDAATKDMPDMFFSDYDEGAASSGSFDTLIALRPHGFMYVGDSHMAANYMDLSVSPEAQKIITSCRENYLYEPIKDFALNRVVRSDIWCRGPVSQTDSLPALFGSFAYGIIAPRENVPIEIKAPGKTIDLSAPVFTKLVDLMTLMPINIGDFLSHPVGKEFLPSDVVGAVQILVACGIAQPMRGLYQSDANNVAQPRFAGLLNQRLGRAPVSAGEIWMASPTLGNVMSIPAREALVMQALDRAGLANSVSVLLPELQRLAKNPGEASRIMDAANPTSDTAHHMIEDTVSRSIVQWYAYGLLEAA